VSALQLFVRLIVQSSLAFYFSPSVKSAHPLVDSSRSVPSFKDQQSISTSATSLRGAHRFPAAILIFIAQGGVSPSL
jgi:hypothetical protein